MLLTRDPTSSLFDELRNLERYWLSISKIALYRRLKTLTQDYKREQLEHTLGPFFNTQTDGIKGNQYQQPTYRPGMPPPNVTYATPSYDTSLYSQSSSTTQPTVQSVPNGPSGLSIQSVAYVTPKAPPKQPPSTSTDAPTTAPEQTKQQSQNIQTAWYS